MGVNGVSFLSDEFLSPYREMEPRNEGSLKKMTYTRTYSRWIPEKMRREYWIDTCVRATNYSVGLYQGPATFAELKAEAELMFDKMFHHEVLPAGRTLFVGGTEASRKWPEANYNCSYLNIEELEDFCEVFALLLVGSGVGFGISTEQVSKLPRFNPAIDTLHEEYETKYPDVKEEQTSCVTDLSEGLAVIFVGDSKEGWVEALRLYLHLHSSTVLKEIRFNYDLVRPAKERLKTFGGRSAGHKGLQRMFVKLSELIKRTDGLVDSVTAMDICNLIASNVVVGGTRRSAQIALGTPGDDAFVNAKVNLYPNKKRLENGTWDFGAANPEIDHRQMSNNSVAYDSKPSREEVRKIFKAMELCGDPGLFNREAARKRRPNVVGLNPCYAPGTMVMTRQGHFPIEQLVGRLVDVWDGTEWRTVDNFRVTGEQQSVYKMHLSSGQEIVATEYHTFILEDGQRKLLRDLQIGDRLMTHEEKVHGKIHLSAAYAKGFLVAEGTAVGSSRKNVCLYLYPPKYVCENRILASLKESVVDNTYGNVITQLAVSDEKFGRRRVQGLSSRTDLRAWSAEYKKTFPADFLNWDYESKCEFIAGVMDGDGTASDARNGFLYQICSISSDWLVQFQLLLRSIGVHSRISLAKAAGSRDFGLEHGGVYQTQDLWRLTISQEGCVRLAKQVKFARLVSFADKELKYVLRNREAIVESIEFSHVADKVYCCTVEESHAFSLSNGVVAGNCAEILLDDNGVCNLSTVVISSHIKDGRLDEYALVESFRLATRIGMRQTNVTLTMPHWDAVQKRDRLTGVSMTGFMDALDQIGKRFDDPEVISWLITWRDAANTEADNYAYEMRIPRPLLVTAVKPEGTISLLPTVSCGMHRGYAPYFLRRISVAEIDPVAQALVKMGVPYEGDATKEKSGRLKFVFPVKTNALVPAADEPARDQLQRYLIFQRHYTDHNTSCTITIGPDEWEEIAEMVYENWDDIVACAFLSKTEDSHPQMPYQRCSEEIYNRHMANFPSMEDFEKWVNYFENGEEFVDGDLDEDAQCSTGACPIR